MSKLLYFDTQAREALKKGVDTLADAVKVTLGPKGRSVIVGRPYGSPIITKDGITVAKDIVLRDPVENMGAQMIKEVASKTADATGDGTTTATVLAQVMVSVGLKNVASGANPMDLKRGMDLAVTAVVAQLKRQSRKIGDDLLLIEQVASISANGDTTIGKLIAKAVQNVGRDGVITVEEAKGMETAVKIVEGMQFDRGHLSPYFITHTEKMETVLENPLILICNKKIDRIADLLHLLEKAAQTGNPLLIIADDIEGEALATLVVNKLRGTLKIAAVKAPAFGDRRKEMLEDLAVITGGTVISDEKGSELKNTELNALGRAEKIVIDKDTTTLINSLGDKENIATRIHQIKVLMDKASGHEKEKLQERMARLSGGVAILYVGAATEAEMKEKKDRVEDAVNATKAAIQEGIVPGGGVAFIRCIPSIATLKGKNEDQNTGISILRRALEEPLRQIVHNAVQEDSVIIEKVKSGINDFGYNAQTEQFENLYESGVIDPTRVARIAIENAVSIAGLLLTTECVVFEKPEKAKKLSAPAYDSMY